MLNETDRRSLIWLQTHWDAYYVIAVADDMWQAARAGHPTTVLTADSARKLSNLLKEDFASMISERGPGQAGESGSL